MAVEPGRVFGSASYALHYAAITVRVAEVLAGSVAGAETLTMEIPLFDGPATLNGLRSQMLDSDRVLFLRNKGTSARLAGLSVSEQRAEAAYYRTVTFGSEIINLGGIAAVPPDDVPVLEEFASRPFDDVLAELRGLAR
jgi:hypothetical protein